MLRGILSIAIFAALAGEPLAEPGSWLSYPPAPSARESSEPQQAQSGPSGQQAAQDKAGGHQIATPEEIERSKAAKAESTDNATEGEEAPSNEWWLMIWTAILAILTGGLVVVAGFQAGLFLIQLRYMRIGVKDAELAAQAAKESADAGKLSADAARLANILSLRAYVTVTQFPRENLVAPDKKFIGYRFGVEWKNTGISFWMN